MKKIIGCVLVLVIFALGPQHLSNAYLRASHFDEVIVQQGDDVWSIAQKYVHENDKTRELAKAIHEVNALDKEGRIIPGQVLKIPVLANAQN